MPEETKIPIQDIKELTKDQLIGHLRNNINAGKISYMGALINYEVLMEQYDEETLKGNMDFIANAMKQAKIESQKLKWAIEEARNLIAKLEKGELII